MAFMAPVGLAATAGGGILGAIGSVMGGQAQAQQYQYRAGVAQVNQQIALQNEGYQVHAGETRALESGLATRQRIGAITAGQGASNLSLNRGSAPLVRTSQAEIGSMEQGIIRENAGRAAYGEAVKATGYGAEATLDTMAARTSRTAGDIGAVSSILGGAASVSSKWLQGTSGGLFGGGSNTLTGGMGLGGNATGGLY